MSMSVLDDANIKRRKITGRATVIFIVVMLALTFFSRTINNFTLPKVTYETPASGALIKDITGIGSVQAKSVRDLYVQTNMRVTEVMVEVGDAVKQGQILLTLDVSDIEIRLMNVQNALQTAQQNLEKAERHYGNSQILYEAGGLPANDLADAKMNFDSARMNYETAKKSLDKAVKDNRDMSKGMVKAPCDGIVIKLNFSEGMTATASQPLYRIADIGGGFQFVATVNISAAEYLESGDGAEITINSLNDKMIQGKVKQIRDNQQQIGVKKDVDIDIPSDGLVGGESGTANIKKNIGFYKTLVSNSAVGQDIIGYFVYVLKERKGPLGDEYYVQKVEVSIGDSDNTKTAVLSGITAMDKVISYSDKPLDEGSSVMIAEELE